jgi:peptidoglycan/xylan/chitin deacetylase (PgdA/CDA1 family)
VGYQAKRLPAVTAGLSDDRTAPASSRVPNPRRRLYYASAHWLHRMQVTRARRIKRAEGPSASGLRIFLYHRVTNDHDELAVTPEAFRAQMEMMLRAGATPTALDEALVALEEGAPGQHVCVTFDDGYHDNLDYAIPVLRDLGIPATIFVPTAVIDGAARLYWYDKAPPTLSWTELRQIGREELFTVGAHSRTHPALQKLTDEAAWDEIAGSRRDLEDRLGRSVTSFAYPAGLQGEREIRMVREAGYRVALTCAPGLNAPGQRPHALHRTPVSRRDSPRMFEARLTGLLDHPWGLQAALKLPTRLRPRARPNA